MLQAKFVLYMYWHTDWFYLSFLNRNLWSYQTDTLQWWWCPQCRHESSCQWWVQGSRGTHGMFPYSRRACTLFFVCECVWLSYRWHGKRAKWEVGFTHQRWFPEAVTGKGKIFTIVYYVVNNLITYHDNIVQKEYPCTERGMDIAAWPLIISYRYDFVFYSPCTPLNNWWSFSLFQFSVELGVNSVFCFPLLHLVIINTFSWSHFLTPLKNTTKTDCHSHTISCTLCQQHVFALSFDCFTSLSVSSFYWPESVLHFWFCKTLLKTDTNS